jgi:Oxaloacetate decarboxylase, gamma chain.
MIMEILAIEWASAFNVIGFSFLMVFLLLILIVFILNILGKFFISLEKTAPDRTEKETIPTENTETEDTASPAEEASGEIIAAISMALYDYFSEKHDKESNIVTIKKVNKPYSPWNSKIYGLNSLDNLG